MPGKRSTEKCEVAMDSGTPLATLSVSSLCSIAPGAQSSSWAKAPSARIVSARISRPPGLRPCAETFSEKRVRGPIG